MTAYTRRCDGANARKCPRDPQCGMDCDFNYADLPTAQEIATRKFWIDLPVTMHEPEPKPEPRASMIDAICNSVQRIGIAALALGAVAAYLYLLWHGIEFYFAWRWA